MRHTYTSQREKREDFWIGFAAWIVINAVVIAVITQLGSSAGPLAAGSLVLANIGAPIVLAFTRGYLALGILVAFAAALALTVVEGVFFTVGDFIMTSQQGGAFTSNPAPEIALLVGLVIFAVGAFFALRAIHRGIK